ncbi:MAG: phospho-sugar mutase, partial [Candidatus Izemoplasmatales bacterium]
YNGYKIYDEFGCQYTPEYADEIVGLVNQVTDVFSVHAMSDEAMKQDGYLHILDGTIDTAYLELVKSIRLYPKAKTTIKTVFTPLHGTSAELGSRLLKECGYPFEAVQEQMVHDPSFSTVKSPNPENPAAFEHAIQLGKKVDADLLIATDPDADRLGVAVKHQGEYVLLTGNQTGAILIRYLLEEKKKLGLLPQKGVVFNTVVTSDLGAKIARSFGFEVISTLTGFKYIGEQARFLEGTDKTFFFGYEESYGYVVNDGVRDKDSLQAMALAIEAANFYWNQEHKTLVDVLEDIYETYGNYREDLVNIELAGMEGKKRIDAIMEYFRQHSPKNVAGFDIVATEDYEKRVRQEGQNTTALVLPISNVLKFFLSDGSWFVLRPSGTEPKLKVYIGVVGVTGEAALSTIAKIKSEVKAIIDTVVM